MDYSATSSSPSFPNAQPFVGIVENTIHALRLVQAARQGLIPRIIRRLNDSERRQMITSGAVFVFSVEESGIKRWTDSMVWSPSRIVGNFLVYKEMCERSGGGRAGQKRTYTLNEQGAQAAQWNSHQQNAGRYEGSSGTTSTSGQLKVDGLIKKTITVTIDGSDLHLISYYTQDDLQSRRLRRISSRPDIANLVLQPHLFRFSSFRNPPKVVTGRDGVINIVCEPEEPEPPESFIAESPDRTRYPSNWPGGIVENVSRQGLAASSPAESFIRGRSATMPSPQFHKHGLQGQYDSLNMTPHEDRGEFHWASEMQHDQGQVVLGRTGVDNDSQPQQQRRWLPPSHPLSSARYDPTPPPFSSYPPRSHDSESEKDTSPGGQMAMMTMTDEHASIYGNSLHHIVAQDRHVGFEQPPWLSANQNAAPQSSHSGIQNSFSLGRPSSSHNPPFAMIHSQGQGNAHGMWTSNRNNDGSYELRYPEPDPATQSSANNFYHS